jgi:tol-pal system protein YbgF
MYGRGIVLRGVGIDFGAARDCPTIEEMKVLLLAPLLLILGPGAFAADKSIIELQRDMALLQDQMRSLDQRIATIQTMVQQIAQQTSEIGTRSDARIDKLQVAVGQTIKNEVAQLAAPIAGAVAKLDGVGNEVSALRDASGETTRQITSLRSQMDEINNVLKTLPSAAASPPSADNGPMVPAPKLFNDAAADMNGKQDLALIEFGDFLRLFPNDPLAPQAQFDVGQIHYGEGQFEEAARDFDAVLAHFPDSQKAPDAMYMKGLSLLKAGQKAAGAEEFSRLVAKFPQSSQASQARDLLRALSPSAPAPAKRPR